VLSLLTQQAVDFVTYS